MQESILPRFDFSAVRAKERQCQPPAPIRSQKGKKGIASLFRLELSLADLEAERLFIRNSRGDYEHTGLGEFEYADTDFDL